MYKRHILTAAVVAVGGIGLAAAPAWAQDAGQAGQAGQAQGQYDARQGQAQPAQPGQGHLTAQPSGRDDAAQIAGERTAYGQKDKTHEVAKTLSKASQAVLGDKGIEKLSEKLSRADRERIGDLSQQQQQLQQSAQQLRQAYKDRYQQELDLVASADQVFTSSFIMIGGAEDQARQASERLAPDSGLTGPPAAGTGQDAARQPGAVGAGTGHDAARDPGAVGAGTGAVGTDTAQTDPARTDPARTDPAAADRFTDRAQPAAATEGERMQVTIPGRQGMQQATIALVREEGSWKIDVPDNLDANQLTQRLNQHLQQAAQQKDQWPQDSTQAQQAIAHHVLMAFAQPAGADAGFGTGARDFGTSDPGAAGIGGTGATGTGATGTGATGTDTSGTSR